MGATLDPLAGTLERFALGRPRNTQPTNDSEPSTLRPYGLRFATFLQPAADLDTDQ